jgi:hypothetical protein
LTSKLFVAGEGLNANAKFLLQAVPASAAALRNMQEAFRAVLQRNMIVLATAHAVSEGIVRRLSGDLARKTRRRSMALRAAPRRRIRSRASRSPSAACCSRRAPTGRRSGEFVTQLRDRRVPIADLALPEYAHGRIPGAIGAIEQPPEIGRE